jgi:putative transposase
VVATLERVCAQKGYPGRSASIRDRSSSRAIWSHGVALDFSRPGKPTDNAFIEAFNSKLRAECLNAHWFMSLEDARQKLEDWRRYYNEDRPHSGIGQIPPILLHDSSGASSPSPAYEAETLASGDPTLGSGASGNGLYPNPPASWGAGQSTRC